MKAILQSENKRSTPFYHYDVYIITVIYFEIPYINMDIKES